MAEETGEWSQRGGQRDDQQDCCRDEVGVVRAVEERGLRMEDKAVGDHGLGAHAQLFHQLRRGQHRATVCTHRAGALYNSVVSKLIWLLGKSG